MMISAIGMNCFISLFAVHIQKSIASAAHLLYRGFVKEEYLVIILG